MLHRGTDKTAPQLLPDILCSLCAASFRKSVLTFSAVLKKKLLVEKKKSTSFSNILFS